MSPAGLPLRIRLSKLLTARSAIRFRNTPTRKNTIHSVAVIVLALPLTVLVFLALAVRSVCRSKLRVLVLAVDGEFAPVVAHLECLRFEIDNAQMFDRVLILSKWRHETLSDLYEDQLKVKIVWGGNRSGYYQQALMLQPKWLVSRSEREVEAYFLRGIEYPSDSVRIPNRLKQLRLSLLKQLNLQDEHYVLMSVYTMEYEKERNPRFYDSVRLLETVGHELLQGVDFLMSRGMGVILVGSPDSGKSEIPRPIRRLADFGALGGPQEFALASCCKYFWTDNVGAWWLSAPFKRPVLHTNFHHKTPLHPTLGLDMHVPRLYKTLDGRLLSIREMLHFEGSLNKAALRGELILVRNSPEDILEAQQEMLAWLNGELEENRSAQRRRECVEQIYSSYHEQDLHPLRMPTRFLEKYESLLS